MKMTNPQQKKDGKIRDIDIRLAFMKRNIKFFEQDGMEFCNEFGINSTNVVDLAGFDFKKNIFYGFEIKSEQDNTDRLYKQLNSYITFFNFVYVITHEKHFKDVMNIISSSKQFDKVGVMVVDSNMNFREVRRARKYDQVYFMFINNLDLEELRILAAEHNLPLEGNKSQMLGVLRRHVPLNEVFTGLKNKIRKYREWKCPCCDSRIYYNRRGNHVCYKCGYVSPSS